MSSSKLQGFLVVDKPRGPSSRDMVNRVQGWFPRGTRIGHAGTLDPLATGVLVVSVGVATRLTSYIQAMPKTYQALLRLGVSSDTDDVEGRISPQAGPKEGRGTRDEGRGVEAALPSCLAPRPSPLSVMQCVQSFLGEIQQVPPAYSAAKQQGRRAYQLARQGRTVSLAPRPVQIHAIDIRRYDFPQLELEVRCGKGTYIRALARDIGKRLGCGGILSTLRRTAVGPFTVENAITLDARADDARQSLFPLQTALINLDQLVLTESEIHRFALGQPISVGTRSPTLPPCEGGPGTFKPSPLVGEGSGGGSGTDLAIFDEAGLLIGVGQLRDGSMLWPTKVLWKH